MKTMHDFYNSLPSNHAIRVARAEYSMLQKFVDEVPTDGEELPDLFALTTKLRSELEDFAVKPPVVVAYISLLNSDVAMMRSIIDALKSRGGI